MESLEIMRKAIEFDSPPRLPFFLGGWSDKLSAVIKGLPNDVCDCWEMDRQKSGWYFDNPVRDDWGCQWAKTQVNNMGQVVGHPLEDDYLKYLKGDNIIYLGYVDWIQDLYDLADVSILSDDGVMIHEAIACKVPIVALTGVKYGRYHNMAAVFPGAVLESPINELEEKIKVALDNISEMKSEAQRYGDDVLNSGSKVADIIINESKK